MRGKCLNLAGIRIGKLTAIEQTNKRTKSGCIIWRCVCDCGGERLLTSQQIKLGQVKDCGCSNISSHSKDITGQRFGKLIALEPTDQREYGSVVWHCQCDCGNDAYVQLRLLTQESVKSCGCLHSPPLKNYIGKRFGHLTVLSYVGKRGGKHVWHCLCDCGNETDVCQSSLQNGSVKSCGCILWKDISGQRFGNLTVLERADYNNRSNAYRWKCICDCGTIVYRTAKSLQYSSEAGRIAACSKCSKHIKGYVEGTFIPRIKSETIQRNNTSGVRGVHYDKSSGMWRAEIRFQKKHITLGRFRNFDEAVAMRKRTEEQLWGRFLENYNTHKFNWSNDNVQSDNCVIK